MVFEVIAITVIALVPRFPGLKILGEVLLWLVVWFALASAAQYFWRFWRRFEPADDANSRPRMVVIRGKGTEDHKDVAAH
jgi:hypothetical protein